MATLAIKMTPLMGALELILADSVPISGDEWVDLSEGLGRVLVADLVSGVDVPPWDNSAMDGYAVRSEDTDASSSNLVVNQRVLAGGVGAHVAPGTAARIFTGAPLPDGADAVIMQENTQLDGAGRLQCLVPVSRGENIRPRGQDIPGRARVLAAGRRLRPQDLGVVASVGVPRLRVLRKLKVGLFSTGNELQEPGRQLQGGQIYNSNRAMLVGLLQALGLDYRDYGIVEDSLDRTLEVLRRASDECDLLISSGGVSVGDEDHVKKAVMTLGEIKLWKLAIKPGKPLAYGRVRGVPFFGLPGNPAAVFVTFGLVVKPYVMALQGIDEPPCTIVRARAAFDWKRPGKRQEYLRATLGRAESGELVADVYQNQSSGVLSRISQADCLVRMPVGGSCRCGDWVDVVLLKDWVY